jgi:hypothetical protein
MNQPLDFLHVNVAANDQAEAGVFRQPAGFSLPLPESKRGRISATPVPVKFLRYEKRPPATPD